ncbi:hypothetical protein K458DRAFT_445033 [Lentithecium fluviatile CBS 122367]|uniref:Glyoxalase-like domain-containing protein n=1 Tax=Lentithecium fluviatile CBS 122367 TaxID=1168545 RepID=A0A6G1IRC7_9PLEO|nr:hypothetical protein K458DRAFT_445033 [Lentithecium fluviatile CBS 122367]
MSRTQHSDALGPAPTRLRQIALVTADLERATQQLVHVLGSEVVFEDPAVAQFGLRNALVPLGGDIIELVSPVQPNTTAGRLLERRGDGGYMVIMQTEDARARRAHIEARELAKVVWGYEHGDVTCVQYHPKGIRGGAMPELDSHAPSPENPTPLLSRFSPWHACGPNYSSYSASMKRAAHLTLQGCVLRLAPGDRGHEAAARQWEHVFGVVRSRDLLAFTNARLGFVSGRDGLHEGLVSITVGVEGRDKLEAILVRASEVGLCGTGFVNMCGIRWYFVLTGHGGTKKG